MFASRRRHHTFARTTPTTNGARRGSASDGARRRRGSARRVHSQAVRRVRARFRSQGEEGSTASSVTRMSTAASLEPRWRTNWRTSGKMPANEHIRNGLGNRYPSLGGSRVRIPRPLSQAVHGQRIASCACLQSFGPHRSVRKVLEVARHPLVVGLTRARLAHRGDASCSPGRESTASGGDRRRADTAGSSAGSRYASLRRG